MSKILANQIANYGDDAPIEIKEGLNIPAGKPIQIAGSSGTNGQVLTTNGVAISWTTPFSGSYSDLTNKPTIPAAQVNADWNAVGTVATILNKPVIPPVPSAFNASPSGNGSLSYNNVNGQFTFTPPNLSSYLTSYTETDPVFSASPAATITNTNKTNWNTAYNWGNHATQGYLTSYTETDPIFNASVAKTITSQDKANWNSAYGWGNHATEGYLKTFTETDPLFSASVAAGISLLNVSNWSTAYAWGDHSQIGYLTDLTTSSVNELNDVFLSTPSNGQVLQYNGTQWINTSLDFLTSVGSIDSHTDVIISSAQNDQLLRYNGTQWVNWTPTYISTTGSIDTHTDVTITSAATDQLLKYNGSLWVNWTPNYLTSTGSIDSHTDVTITSAANNQLLRYNGTQWVNWTPNYLTSYTETDTLATVTARGANTTTPVTLQNLTVAGNLIVQGTTTQNNVTSLTVTSSEIVINEGQASGGLNALIKNERGSDPDVAIRWNEVTDKWQFTNDGTTYYNIPTNLNDLGNDPGYLTSIGSISDHTDVTISSISDAQLLRYNNATSNWENWTPNYITTTGSIDTHTDVTIASVSANQLLRYNNATSQWENWTPNFLTSTGSLDTHTDVTLSSVLDGQLLRYNNATSEWQNWTPNFLTSVGVLDSHTDVVITSPSSGQVLTYNGSQWVNSSSSVTAKAAVSEQPPSNATAGDVWWKSDEGALKIYYDDGNTSQWVDASPVGDPFENVYASIAFFPGANVNKGSFAFSEATGSMYYSNGVSWTSQRLVTTNSSTTSDFATLLANTQLTYSVSAVDGLTQDEKKIRLSSSQGVTSDITLVAGDGLSVIKSNNTLTFSNDYAFTYSISAETATGSNAKFRLLRSDGTNDDIVFAGADGLTVERTDASTITFRAPDITELLYTNEQAQDAAAQLFINGTHENITVVYDDINNVINLTAAAGGGGGGTTYDLFGSNTTSNNAIITLRDANTNEDSIEITGGGGTSVTWDGANDKITVSSTAPVNADWNATTGLAQILNKPTIPAAYSLPIATGSVLGGIKVGANLSINPATGVLDANPGSYTLPTASGSTLGGIKVGSGLTIDGNGVLNATGGSTVPTIQDLSGTTASLAADATAELNITGYKAYSLFKITTDAEAWVRVYVDDASRDADSTRSEGEDPTPGGGVIAEVRTSGAESILITPGIMGFNNDSPRTDTIYLAVTNRSGAATTITVTLTALQIGE